MEITEKIIEKIIETDQLFSGKKYLQNMYLLIYQMKKEDINIDIAQNNISIAKEKKNKRGNALKYNSTIQSNCQRKDKDHEVFYGSFRDFGDAVKNNSLLDNSKFTLDLNKHQMHKFSELFQIEAIDENQEDELGDINKDIISRTEGGEKVVISRQKERNPGLRKLAIKIHKLVCQVCFFDFGKRYGEWGQGFIEVHHIHPLGQSKDTVQTDPEKDMNVLCANCHRMIHRKHGTTLTIDELKTKFKNGT